MTEEVSELWIQYSKDLQKTAQSVYEQGIILRHLVKRQRMLEHTVEQIRAQMTVQYKDLHDLMKRLHEHCMTFDAHKEPIE